MRRKALDWLSVQSYQKENYLVRSVNGLLQVSYQLLIPPWKGSGHSIGTIGYSTRTTTQNGTMHMF